MNLQEKLNYFGKNRVPFFFLIGYDLTSWEVIPLQSLPQDIKYSINSTNKFQKSIKLETIFEDIDSYKNKFDQVISNIKKGNTYLLNLTSQTKILNKISLDEVYNSSDAKYKLYYKDKFVSFSPETFVQIDYNTISTFPMKGTIDASIPNAQKIILDDKKELAEHTMVVDLLRNDLNIVAKNIKVQNFRYAQTIKAGKKQLIQISSKITGSLKPNWHTQIGDILVPMLPAGSITGTPKKKTVELINKIEQYNRDYFTGIWGIYDGNSLNSAVLIRYIQKQNNQLYYKSGGGITLDSDMIDEYNEMKNKVYI